jgi:hypothetical protein
MKKQYLALQPSENREVSLEFFKADSQLFLTKIN